MKALDCATLGLLVHPYVDGELVGEDKDAVETHVQRCARCGAALAREQELLGIMRAVGPLHRAPAGLREAVGGMLASSAPNPRQPRPSHGMKGRARLLLALLPAVLVLALAGVLWRQGARTPFLPGQPHSPLVTLGVDTHLRHARGQLPLEVRSDRPLEVAGWFAGRVPFNLTLPEYPVGAGESKPYTLVGGRLVALDGDYAAYVAYRMQDRPISLLVTSSGAARPAGGVVVTSGRLTFHVESVAGLKVITWVDHGLVYALVSDLREEGARSCLVCHGTELERRKLEGLRRLPSS
jgi:anti-sigma factor RsiW